MILKYPNKSILFFVFLFLLLSCQEAPEDFVPNYDESKVPEYKLPDPLTFRNGKPVSNASDWYSNRRTEILKLFEEEIYGEIPAFEFNQVYVMDDFDSSALNGKAIRKQVTIKLIVNDSTLDINVIVFLPKSEKPVPAFLGYNFNGNHTVHSDTKIFITRNWVENRKELGIENNQANETSRGAKSSRWPVELIIDRGFALATVYYGDVDPDFDDGFHNGIHGLIYCKEDSPARCEWGSIAAWAFGLRRVMDWLETEPAIMAQKVIVIGHSRLGKTALWAGAVDERFAAVISNNSGCGGAALSRRQFGETVERINTVFPHWFCDNFNKYNNKEKKLPVDQHMLIALMAPRPVYVASATDDLWADPRGEFLAALEAGKVYQLLGLPGISVKTMPEPDHPATDGYIGYHLRTGKHDITAWDWEQYLNFVSFHLKI
jgi:hypothetical protein